MNKITTSLLFIIGISLLGISQPTFDWAGQIGGTGVDFSNAVTTDASGNVYVTGSFTGTVDFDFGSGVQTIASTGRDAFVAKYDSDGLLIWAVNNASSSSNCSGDFIEIDYNGNVIIVGHFSGTADMEPGSGVTNIAGATDWYVQKLDGNGQLLWAHGTGSSAGDEATGLAVGPNGDVVVSGYYADITDFDPGTGIYNLTPSVSGWEEGFIYKLDENGTFQWANTLAGKTMCYGAAISPAGDIYVTGQFLQTADFNPGSGVYSLTSTGAWDLFALKMNSSGGFIWANSTGGTDWEIANDLILDGNENLIITGYFKGTTDLSPGAGTSSHVSNGGNDIFVQKLNSSGNFLWSAAMGGATNDYGVDLEVDSDNNIYTSGFFSSTVDFDPSGSVDNITAQGGYDGFIQCLNENGNYLWGFHYSGSGTETTSGISIDQTGNLYACGSFDVDMDVDPTAGSTAYTSTMNDGFVTKLAQCISSTLVLDQTNLPDLTSQCSVTAPTAPTASNCTQTFNGTPDVSFPITTQGTTTVTWTYDDGNGNTITQMQNVVIDDATAPIADLTTLTNITSECPVTSLTMPTATDNCVGSVTGTHNVTLPITASGTTVVTWTYDDGNGNTSTQTQDVVITPIDNGATQVDAVTLSADATGYTYQWVDCNNGNQTINGATSQTFVATANGSYAVEIDNGTCSVNSNCIVINQVGIDDLVIELVEIYPNPTTGTIHISSSVPFNQVEVMNALGQRIGTNKISETSKYSLTLPEENGIYFVKIYMNETAIVKRVVKR